MNKPNKLQQIYEGKAKKVFKTSDPQICIVEYKDDATAFNGEKKGTINSKGIINNVVTNHIMSILEEKGIKTHLLKEISDRETMVRKVDIVPIEVIVRNIAAGSLSTRLGLKEGTKMEKTVLEYCYKDDSLGDPIINEYHIAAINLCSKQELDHIASVSLHINEILKKYFLDLGIILVDFKLEFGRTSDNEIILADEISPDTCRFWDSKTNRKLDKDLFRRDMGGVEEAYEEVLLRLMGRKLQ